MPVGNGPEGTVALLTYDYKTVTLPTSAAIHCKRLRDNFIDVNGVRKDGKTGAFPLTSESDSNCVYAAVLYA